MKDPEGEALRPSGLPRGGASPLDLEDVLDRLASRTADLLPDSTAQIWVVGGGDMLRLGAEAGSVMPCRARRKTEKRIGEGLSGRVAETKQALFVDDPARFPAATSRSWLRAQRYRAYLGVPLLSRSGELMGVLALYNRGPERVTQQDIERFGSFGSQAALALENAQLLAAADRRRKEAEALARIARTLAASLSVAEVAESITRSVGDLFGSRNAVVRLLRPDGGLVLASYTEKDAEPPPDDVLPPGVGVTGKAIAEGRPAQSPDLLEDPAIALSDTLRRRLADLPGRSALTVPLRVEGEIIGTLSMRGETGHVFSEPEVKLLEAFADQAALALANARNHEEARRRQREAEVLAELARSINASLDLPAVLQRVAEGAAELCGGDSSTVATRDRESGAYVFRYRTQARYPEYDGLAIEPGKGAGGQVLLTGRPFRTDDYLHDSRISRDYDAVVRAEGTIAVLVVPIKDGELIEGLIHVARRSPRPFTDGDEAVLLRLAEHAAVAMRNAGLYAELEREFRHLEALLNVSQAVAGTLDLTGTMRRVAREMARALGADTVGAYLADADRSVLRPMAGYHVPPYLVDAFRRFPFPLKGHRAIEEAWETRRPAWTSDAEADPRIDRPTWARFPHRASAFVPMVNQDELIGGLFVVWWEERRELTAQDLRLALGIASQAASAVEKARLYEESEHRRREAEALGEVGHLVFMSLDPPVVARQIVDSVRRLLGAGMSVLYRLEPGSGDLVLLSGVGTMEPVERLPPGTATAGLAVLERRPVATADVLADARISLTAEVRARIEGSQSRAVLALPLVARGEVLGALAVGDRPGRRFEPQDLLVAQRFADHAAVALQNARLYQDTRESEALLAREKEVLELIAASAPVSHVLDRVCRSVEELSAGARCSILLLDPDGLHLRHGAAPSLPEAYRLAIDGLAIGPRVGCCGTAAYLGTPVIVADIAGDPLWQDYRHLALPHGLRACWSTPLLGADGSVLGTFAVYYSAPREPVQSERSLIERMGHIAGIAIERSRAVDTLRRSEERYRALVTNIPQVTWVADRTGRVVFVSPNCDQVFGAGSAKRFLESEEGWRGWIHPDDAQRVQDRFARLFAGTDRFDVEFRFQRNDGGWIWVHDRAVAVYPERGTMLAYGVCEDITERKLAAALRSLLLNRAISAQEEERARVARELHDETGQSLAALALGLGRLKETQSMAEVRSQAEELHRLTARALAEVRRLAWGLRPSVLDDLGLVAAIDRYAAEYAKVRGIAVRLRAEGMDGERLPAAVETTLYRIAQEALANVAKHAAARTVTIVMERRGPAVSMTVEDDGIGFEVGEALAAPDLSRGLGLHGMRERAVLLKGCFAIDSSPGRGTTVRVEIPLAEDAGG